MQYNPDEYTEILNIFKAESEEIIQSLNDGFLQLEKNPNDKTPIKKLFQLAHSIKGAARMIGFNGIQDIAHKLEDILTYWGKDSVSINTDSFDLIYKICDFLNDAVIKSVEKGSDYIDDNLMNFLIKLDNYINDESKNLNKTVDKKAGIYAEITDINASLLELMFVLEKNDDNSDTDEIIMVALDNLYILKEIFDKSNLSVISNKILEIYSYLETETDKSNAIKNALEMVISLKSDIYNELNVADVQENISKKDEPQKEVVSNINKNIEENFDLLLKNLVNIKSDKNYINEIISKINIIKEQKINENSVKILNKINNILKLIQDNGINVENDMYMPVLQGLYLAKRLYLDINNENIQNFNFLMQRLDVVEQLFNITTSKKAEIKKHSIFPSVANIDNDIDILKKNINSFDLQEIKTLRVDTGKIDNLITKTGELLVNGIKTKEHLLELSNISTKLTYWNSTSKKIITYLKYLEKKGLFNSENDSSFSMFYKKAQNFFINNADLISDIQKDFGTLYNVISEDDNRLHQAAIGIDNIAKEIRILPLATIFHSFPRMIRDLASENNKKIEFIVSGSDTTIDKKLIEEIKMPLIHILRNAVSHGIEQPQDRIKNGKPEAGVIKLSAQQKDNNIILTVEDDGYGINIEKVKRIALSKGILDEDDIENISDEQIMKLLFLPGFSTNDSIDEISGRGIGLDIVKTKINNLNGEIKIDSVMTKGCRVTIRLPLLISTVRVFIFMINNQKYAIPISVIKNVKYISKEDIFSKNGRDCIIFDDYSIPIYSFSDVIGEKEHILESGEKYTAIIIENQKKQAAFITDKLIGDQDIFHKKLIPPIIKIKNISGFTTLSSGEICLIINPYELLNNIFSKEQNSQFKIDKISKNSMLSKQTKNILIYDNNEINFVTNAMQKSFKNTVVLNKLEDVYDYIINNSIDIFICKIDYKNKDLVKLLQYMKNDEILFKTKIVIISDMASFDILNILNYFKPDLYVRLSEYNEEQFINAISEKL